MNDDGSPISWDEYEFPMEDKLLEKLKDEVGEMAERYTDNKEEIEKK